MTREVEVSGQYVKHRKAPVLDGKPRCTLDATCCGEEVQVGLSDFQLEKGIALIGAPGTGKSTAMSSILRQLRMGMTDQDILFIFDPKGDFRKDLSKEGDIFLGCGSGGRAPNVRWSLFKEAIAGCRTQGEVDVRVRTIAQRLIPHENIQTPIFTDGPRQACAALIDTFLHCPQLLPAGQLTNEAFLHFVAQMDFQTVIYASKRYKGLMRDLLGETGRVNVTQQSHRMEVLVNTNLVLEGFNRAVEAKAPLFSVVQAEKERGGQVVFLQLDMASSGLQSECCGLLVDLLIGAALDNSKRQGMVYLGLDELPQLGKPTIDAVQKAAAVGRDKGICLITAFQSLSQLEEICGQEASAALMNNLQTSFHFRTSDGSTKRRVQALCGRIRTREDHFTPVGLQVGTVTETDSIRDDELLGLGTGQAVFVTPEKTACLLHLKNYGR